MEVLSQHPAQSAIERSTELPFILTLTHTQSHNTTNDPCMYPMILQPVSDLHARVGRRARLALGRKS
jgi:hypothetical protein